MKGKGIKREMKRKKDRKETDKVRKINRVRMKETKKVHTKEK
jgi:hypothetical protein